MKTYRSNGKLLLTGEYVVLDGAKALAIPTQYNQSLTVEQNTSNTINWKSHDEKGNIWYEDTFTFENTSTALSVTSSSINDISKRLIQILKATRELNSKFLSDSKGFNITTYQDFSRKWGLGTSSTLINNIAKWADVDAYRLLEKTFGGSGYDIACAQHNYPITFQLDSSKMPTVNTASFDPSFKDCLYLVYLNQKQNSRDGIASYKKHAKIDKTIIEKINSITDAMIACETLSEFEILMNKHEAIISNLIKKSTIKSTFFNDFKGAVKSLGAWGGDFVLVTSKTDPSTYFKSKGFETIISYSKMIYK